MRALPLEAGAASPERCQGPMASLCHELSRCSALDPCQRWTPSASSFTISSSPWTTLDVCGVNCDRAGAADPRADYTTSCQAHHDPQH
mmetsp:Transcript_7385/g.20105  ORF Transcript_7385/g.20105 Transcript_7385/m.20105 type:complete len:88 (-) Transcript_7385:228-491(-)